MLKLTTTGKTSSCCQRDFCPICKHCFTDSFDTIYYRRQLNPKEVHTILQSYCEGSSLRGMTRSSGRADGTVVHQVLHCQSESIDDS